MRNTLHDHVIAFTCEDSSSQVNIQTPTRVHRFSVLTQNIYKREPIYIIIIILTYTRIPSSVLTTYKNISKTKTTRRSTSDDNTPWFSFVHQNTPQKNILNMPNISPRFPTN
jgi:hypothetical protein